MTPFALPAMYATTLDVFAQVIRSDLEGRSPKDLVYPSPPRFASGLILFVKNARSAASLVENLP